MGTGPLLLVCRGTIALTGDVGWSTPYGRGRAWIRAICSVGGAWCGTKPGCDPVGSGWPGGNCGWCGRIGIVADIRPCIARACIAVAPTGTGAPCVGPLRHRTPIGASAGSAPVVRTT